MAFQPLSAFRQDFEGWSLEHFQTASIIELGKLVDLLQTSGVFVNRYQQL